MIFLSTPSARRATTQAGNTHLSERKFLSTPSARRATGNDGPVQRYLQISIHALREEGDFGCLFHLIGGNRYFYPRPPRGGRQPGCRPRCRFSKISIHALREEGDAAGGCSECVQKNFYPRPPRGGRRFVPSSVLTVYLFLSTPSARRATVEVGAEDGRVEISIHALREEGDFPGSVSPVSPILFLSTPSARRATGGGGGGSTAGNDFYPRPPRGGRPAAPEPRKPAKQISIHALREEGDSKNRDKISIFKQIIQHSARI